MFTGEDASSPAIKLSSSFNCIMLIGVQRFGGTGKEISMTATSDPIKEAVLITSGDLRQSANLACWPAQEEMERKLTQSFAREGLPVRRAFSVDSRKGHGFISSQRMGMDIFADIDPGANLIFATAAWQYTHHVLP